MPPPFSAFPPPPPPPPQNGLALDYGGSLYAAGAVQGPVEAGGVVNSVANSLSVQVSAWTLYSHDTILLRLIWGRVAVAADPAG